MPISVRRPEGKDPIHVLVAGVGHLGKNHARVYTELEGVVLEGVVDSDAATAEEIGTRLGVPHYSSLTPELLSKVHAASIVTPTPTHGDVARECIEAGVSVLVEKPMTSTSEQARELLALADGAGVTLQVGHIERFNPVVIAAHPFIRDPVYIECDRIHPFSFRSVETSVVLDLMIHDIDIALNLVDAPVVQLEAVGAKVLSETEDLASARLTFQNGCTVMVKASRVAIQKSRKMRIFNKDSYLSLDYIAKTGMLMGFKDGFDRSKIDIKEMAQLEEDQGAYPLFTKYFSIEQLHVASDEPLKNELQSFLLSVRTGREPVVTGSHGLQAIEIAMQIQDKIREQQRIISSASETGGESSSDNKAEAQPGKEPETGGDTPEDR